MDKIKLTVELIPSTVFFNNVRSALSQSDWDRLRKESYAKAGNVCEICSDTGKNQGYRHNVECHEIWDYNYKTETQRLVGLISLCPRCHQIKHIGRTFAIGKQAEAFRHLEKVNKWNHKQVVTYLVECFIEHKKKSKIHWKLDLTILTTNFGVDKLKISKGSKKKVVVKPFWRKGVRKKSLKKKK